MHNFILAVTDMGDVALTGTLTILLALYLWMSEQRKPALAIIAAFVISASAIALCKIVLYSRCNAQEVFLFNLRSPSGHSAIATAVYLTAARILARSKSVRPWRPAIYVSVALVILGIAASRFMLGYHTLADVVIGLGAGLLTAAGVRRWMLKGEKVHCVWWPFAILIAFIFALLHGHHFPSEELIAAISTYIRGHLRTC